MTITILRPTSDDSVLGTVTKIPNSGTYFDKVDDAPSDDNTAITSSQTGAGVYFGLTDITLSAGQRVRQARIRARFFHNSADVGHEDFCDLRLRDSVGGKTAAVWTAHTSSNTAVEDQSGWYTADPNGKAWTETVVDRLQIASAFVCRSTGLTQLRISELYVDVDVRQQLSVSSVTVTGATTSTRPSFSFVLAADPDGDAQTRWQAKMFTAAQYGASGFDPATSPSTWDSTVQNGAGTTGTVGVDTLNGVTYKIYVRAAKGWTGPAGSLWWSDWTGSTAFTVNLTPPATPTISVTPELTLPGYRNRIVVGLAGLNLLDADTAGFDSTAGFWVAGANTNTPAQSATNPKSGAGDLLLTATAAGTIEALSGSFGTSRRIDPGAVVSVTASFRALVTARNWQVGIRFFDVAGSTISTTMGSAVADSTGGYTTAVLLNQTAPANAYSMVVRVLSAAAASAEQHRVDEVGIIVGATAPWTPGGAAQSGTILIERSKRVSKTIGRGPARNWVHPQVYSAGALTTSTDGFYPRQALDGVVQSNLDRPAPESPLNTTAGMIEWQIRVGSFSYLDIGAPDGVPTDGMHPYLFPAVPGLSFTGSAWLWGSAAITVRLGLVFVDAFNTQIGSTTLTANTALTTTSQKLSIAATAPAGTVYARLVVEDTLAATGISVFVTQPKFRLTADPDEAWPGQVFAFTWETVRASGRAVPQNGDVTASFYDHEAPPGRPIMYRVTLLATTATGEMIASNPSAPVSVYMDLPAVPILKDPLQPENAMTIFRNPDTLTRTEDSTVLHGMGRDGDPVKIRSWRGGTDGQLSIEVVGALEKYRAEQLLGSLLLLLQHHDGGQTYLIPDPATMTELSPAGTPFWSIVFNYLEVADPS